MSKPEVPMIGPYPAWDMDDLDARYVLHKLWEAADCDHLVDANRGAIRAIATRGELGASADLMKRLPALEIVSCYGVGTDAIDLAYARANRIKVTNTPDVLTGDVADMVVGPLLSAKEDS
jgi:lactate dehydrogenase-like 2-hydroxyacid dehydrogenase